MTKDLGEYFKYAANMAPGWSAADVANFLRTCGFDRESELFEEQVCFYNITFFAILRRILN